MERKGRETNDEAATHAFLLRIGCGWHTVGAFTGDGWGCHLYDSVLQRRRELLLLSASLATAYFCATLQRAMRLAIKDLVPQTIP